MSTEMLDLDEALTFLSDVANGADKVNPTTVPTLRTWTASPAPSPEPPQRVSIGLFVLVVFDKALDFPFNNTSCVDCLFSYAVLEPAF